MSIKLYQFTLEVLAPPGWFLTLSALALAVPQGTPAHLTVTATPENGFAGPLNVYVIGVPIEADLSVVPAPLYGAPWVAEVEISTDKIAVGPAMQLQILGVSDGPQPADGRYIVGDTPAEIAALLEVVQPGAEVYMLGDPERKGYRLAWGTMAARPVTGTPFTCYYATDLAAIYYAGATGAWEAYAG